MRVSICIIIIVLCFLLDNAYSSVDCSSYGDCLSCTGDTTLGQKCMFCPKLGTCFNFLTPGTKPCSDYVQSSAFCPASTTTGGGGTGPGGNGGGDKDAPKFEPAIPAAFSVLWALLIAGLSVLYVFRKRAIAPIVDIHKNRSDMLDFSAFGDLSIGDRMQQIAAGEQILWADVQLKIPTLKEIIIGSAFVVFGVIVLIVGAKVVEIQKMTVIVLVFTLFPLSFLIGRGLHQLITGRHYGDLYCLTPSGAIMASTGCMSGSTHFPYVNMVPVQTHEHGNGISSVHFAEKLEKNTHSKVHHHKGNAHHYNQTKYTKHSIGFDYITNGLAAAGILRERIAVAQVAPGTTVVLNQVVANPASPYAIVSDGYPPHGLSAYPPQQQQQPQPGYPSSPYPPSSGYSVPQQQQPPSGPASGYPSSPTSSMPVPSPSPYDQAVDAFSSALESSSVPSSLPYVDHRKTGPLAGEVFSSSREDLPSHPFLPQEKKDDDLI